jgi:N-acetylmuramoyl-L-alanine amidase
MQSWFIVAGTRAVAPLACVFALAGCGAQRYVEMPSLNQSARPDHIVIHFTGESFAEATRLLTERTEIPVSAHYVIPEHGDPSYPRRRLRIHRLVDEGQRAWHAGDSYWHGVASLNARSIGVEIVNRSRCVDIAPDLEPPMPANQRCEFLEFDPEQIELVVALVDDIVERHPRIDPVDIVGHADIAPQRRADPGPRFPWRKLYEHGLGAWYDDATVERYRARFEAAPPSLETLQRALHAYGYGVEPTGEHDGQTQYALRAFQMHFRPADWSGRPDVETAAILFALLEKYRRSSLTTLL